MKRTHIPKPRIGRRGMTMVELLFASALSVLVGGTMLLLMMVMTRANQALYSEDQVLQEGDRIMRNLELVLRAGSRDQGGVVVYSAGNISGNSCTARVRVPRSSGITAVPVLYTSEIRFGTDAGPEQGKLIVDENVATTTDPLEILSKPSTSATDVKPYVTNIQFSIPTDPNTGNTPVATSIRVMLKLVAPGNWTVWRGPAAETQRTIVRTITLREP